MKVNSMAGFYSRELLERNDKLTELAQLISKLRDGCLTGDRYLPMCDVRRYNELVHEMYGDELGEDPEIEEAKAEKHTGEFRIEMDDLVFGRDPVARQDQDVHYMLQKAGMEGE